MRITRIIMALLLLLSGVESFGRGGGEAQAAIPAAPNALRARVEEMARRYTHFSLTVMVSNRPLRLPLLGDQQGLADEQLRLLAEMRDLSPNRDALAALLRDTDPKVRTLALGALFQREDGRDLPLIASLLEDRAETFPLFQEPRRAGGVPARSEWERSQAVGDVAESMLKFWGVGGPGRGEISAEQFQAYWARYAGRAYAASWFRVKMDRATRRTTPILTQYRPDIDRVVAQIDALPAVDRAWTRLYVLWPGGSDPEYIASNRIVPDEELVQTARELGSEALLRFLRRQPVTDDPDLNLTGKDNHDFTRIANFILLRAAELLRPGDAEALLVCEQSERSDSGVNPAWVIGAALLQPEKTSALLRPRLQNENRNYLDAAAQLAGALWRILGPEQGELLTDWFYAALPEAAEPFHQPEIFLRQVRAVARPDTYQLLVALMRHPRFELTDWPTLKEMLQIVNGQRAEPLVSTKEIYDAWPSSSPDSKRHLAGWRNLLRHEFGVPERPVPEPAPRPQRELNTPLYATPIPWPPSQLILSPSGRTLATLNEGSIGLWDASTGQGLWSLPRTEGAWCSWMAFRPAGERLLLLYQNQFPALNDWDVATRQRVGHVLLTNLPPTSSVSDGAYAFNLAAGRLGFAGDNEVSCFDVQSGQGLWVQTNGGGVRSVVALSPDGRLLAVGGGHRAARRVQVREAATGNLVRVLDAFAGRVEAIAFTADGRSLAASSAEDGLRVWSVASGKLEREYCYPPRSKAAALSFSSNGQWLAIAAAPISLSESRIGVFEVRTGLLAFEIRCPHHPAAWHSLLTFSPDGRLLYTADNELSVWPLVPR
jgi:hypothetical protein